MLVRGLDLTHTNRLAIHCGCSLRGDRGKQNHLAATPPRKPKSSVDRTWRTSAASGPAAVAGPIAFSIGLLVPAPLDVIVRRSGPPRAARRTEWPRFRMRRHRPRITSMTTNQMNATAQTLPPAMLLSMQISVVGTTLGTIGFLGTFTANQAAVLRGPVPLGGFTLTQIAWTISAVAVLAYLLAERVVLGTARRRMSARSPESSPGQGATLLTLYATRTAISVALLNAIVGVCGAAYLVEHDTACLAAASVASLLALLHLPWPNRVSRWIEQQVRLIDEEQQVRRLTALGVPPRNYRK
jgi:hypothetical protein